MEFANLDISKETKILINENLSSYNRAIWNKYKKLWKDKSISSFCVIKTSIRSLETGGQLFTIAHISDLKDLFPTTEYAHFYRYYINIILQLCWHNINVVKTSLSLLFKFGYFFTFLRGK